MTETKIKFRYKKPDENKSIEMIHVQDAKIKEPSIDFNFAAAIALYGMKLRQSKFDNDADLSLVLELAKRGIGKDEEGYRAEFIRLVNSYNYLK